MKPNILPSVLALLLTIRKASTLSQTYTIVTRLTSHNHQPIYCSQQHHSETSELYQQLNTDVCESLRIAKTSTVTINQCQVFRIKCEGRQPLVESKVVVETSGSFSSTDLHNAIRLQKLLHDTVITIDFMQIKDYNECEMKTHSCDNNAICKNLKGSYTCACKSSFIDNSPVGFDGRKCDVPCGDSSCKNGGSCTIIDEHSVCKCLNNFTGRDCSVNKSDVQWLWMLGASLVVSTLVLIPAIVCIVVIVKHRRQNSERNLYLVKK